jgi:hypothetical protein
VGVQKLQKSSINFVTSVRMRQLSSHCNHFHKISYFKFCQNLPRNFNVHYNLNRLSYILHVHIDNFMIICSLILVRNLNISDKFCIESQTTHFVLKKLFSGNLAFYGIMRENFVQSDRPQMILIRRMGFACG